MAWLSMTWATTLRTGGSSGRSEQARGRLHLRARADQGNGQGMSRAQRARPCAIVRRYHL